MTTEATSQSTTQSTARPMAGAAAAMANSRRQAAATRRSSRESSTRLLSRPGSQYPAPIDADSRFGPTGRVVRLGGFDTGQPAPDLPEDAAGGLIQRCSIDEICDQLVAAHVWPAQSKHRLRVRGAQMLLERLADYPGDTWEQRWLASGFDAAARTWASQFPAPATGIPPVQRGVNALLQARVLRPSYSWLLNSGRRISSADFLRAAGGHHVDTLRQLPNYLASSQPQQRDAEICLTRVMIRTGKTIDQLVGDDLLHYSDVVKTSGRNRREHLIWELLVQLGPLAGETPTLRAAWSANGNSRQHSTATLVDRYGIPASGVRDLLVAYLDELRPGMDYASLEGLAYRLVRLFWWEIVQINPAQADLRLSPAVTTTWRERLARTTDGVPRRELHSILFAIRGLYRDLAEWAHDDPVRWGVWVAPCPVPRTTSRAAAKDKRRQKQDMQQRTRVLTPLLPTFLAATAEHHRRTATFLELARACPSGEAFVFDDLRFIRVPPPAYAPRRPDRIWVDLGDGAAKPIWVRHNGSRIDATAVEEDGFWAWAIVETLHHTGIRIEELLELTQLSLRHYTAPTTGTVVPLLHIVPSKTDSERLVPMTPELVNVLLAVLRRAKNGQDRVPSSIRYDPHEKVHGEPFPHLFARRIGTRQEVLSTNYVSCVLGHLATICGLTDTGRAIRFTPHDFRRLFATDAVNNGLPLHIAAALLGHLNLDTTRGYTAVFPEHLITAHQAFIDRRRELRPHGEHRIAEPDEWAGFEHHFLLRRVALGECHRPYGTPCVHEHACVRCRFLRVDPAQRGRLEEMTDNAEKRLVEAKQKTWLGEVAALEESLQHLRRRRDEVDHARKEQADLLGPVSRRLLPTTVGAAPRRSPAQDQ